MELSRLRCDGAPGCDSIERWHSSFAGQKAQVYGDWLTEPGGGESQAMV